MLNLETKAIKVGLIGCGTAAHFFHAPAYYSLKGIEVVAIADPDEKNRNLTVDILGNNPNQYEDAIEMLRKERLDFVDVMLPHHLYVSMIPKIAIYTDNILIEKPFATSLDEAQQILESTQGKRVSVVHNYLYGFKYQQALEKIHGANSITGPPFCVRLENLRSGMQTLDPSLDLNWRGNMKSGYGSFHDHGYHTVYLARALMGSEIKSVTAIMANYSKKGQNYDFGSINLEHENGGTSIILDGRLLNSTSIIVEEIIGSKGTVIIPESKHLKPHFDNLFSNYPRYEALRKSPFGISTSAAIKDFAKSIQDNTEAPISFESARRTLAVTLAALESVKESRKIELHF